MFQRKLTHCLTLYGVYEDGAVQDDAKQINKMSEMNDWHVYRDDGTGGQEGQPPPLPFTRRGKGGGAKVPFQFKGLPWRNSELSEMLVQFFYEFASENARNAVIEF
jgi:hypothetical protein